MPYNFTTIERKWQQYWLENKTYRALDPHEAGNKPKAYLLDMFPYPSGSGLHVGHPEGYTATDIVSRHLRMKGYNVLHPMGWDAFGLPAEEFARKNNVHPAVSTKENVDNFRKQIRALGLGYDWDREVNTTDASYYKWTQWIFLQLFNSYFDKTQNRAMPIATCSTNFRTRTSSSRPTARSSRTRHRRAWRRSPARRASSGRGRSSRPPNSARSSTASAWRSWTR